MAGKGKPGKTADSRERILAAAVRLFALHGYGNTGVRELATVAGVNLAMVNYFFGSKKALLKEILDIFFSGYLEVARRELPGPEEPAVRLERFIHAAVDYFAAHRDYLLVTITELPHDDPDIIEHKASWGRQMIETVQLHLGGNRNDREREKGVPPVVFCSMLTSMMASRFLFTPLMEQVQPEQVRSMSNQEYAAIVSRVFLQGIGGPGCETV